MANKHMHHYYYRRQDQFRFARMICLRFSFKNLQICYSRVNERRSWSLQGV